MSMDCYMTLRPFSSSPLVVLWLAEPDGRMKTKYSWLEPPALVDSILCARSKSIIVKWSFSSGEVKVDAAALAATAAVGNAEVATAFLARAAARAAKARVAKSPLSASYRSK